MTPVSRDLGVDDLPDLVAGLMLLGSGGGGDPRILAAATARQLAAAPVRGIGLDDLAPDDLVVPVGYIGSTSVLREKLPSGTELPEAVQALTRWTGTPPAALMPLEMAGVNGLAPLAAASMTGLPLLDADLMGRAFPRIDQSSLVVSGRAVSPCAAAEPGGRAMLLDGVSPSEVESLLRLVIAHSSGWAALALPPQRAVDLRETAITGTAERALRLGRALRAPDRSGTPAGLAEALGGTLLGHGRVVDVVTAPRRGRFDVTTVSVVDERSGAVIRLEAENEFVVALADGRPVAASPDLIAVIAVPGLSMAGAGALLVDAVRPGAKVAVVALEAPAWWTATPERRAAVSPRAFGFGPVEVPA
ncbi:hypothetical protein BFL35_02895 [Clavibacter michiganensis]|nr:hypothetical protein BFL35_02895 [Clavibacter michiganensis]